MTLQNRYYSDLGQASFITNAGGISNSMAAVTVQATVRWPTSLPFVVRFEPGGANEEVGLVTSGAGTSGSPYQITRGYSGTTAFAHDQGSAIIPGFCQLDFAEPQQHLNLSGANSGAHGLPASAWGYSGPIQNIGQVVPNANQASITFSSIPQTYSHLFILYELATNTNAAASEVLLMQINGDAATHYGGAIWACSNTGTVTGSASVGDTAMTVGYVYQAGTPAVGTGFITLPNYSTPNYHNAVYTTMSGDAGTSNGNQSGGGGATYNVASHITSLTFFPATSSGFSNTGAVSLYAFL